MILKTGAIYSLRYTRWKTNFKIYAFIMWGGGPSSKTHLLNIGAKQLSILDRTKIIRTIVRLSKIPTSNKYDGRMLYKIFKTYLSREIKKCYRTFFPHAISQSALVNYGLNKAEDFTEMELAGTNQQLFEQAQRDFQIKAMNLYSGRGHDLKKVKGSMAGDNTSGLIKDDSDGGASTIQPATRDATRDSNITDDDDYFGY